LDVQLLFTRGERKNAAPWVVKAGKSTHPAKTNDEHSNQEYEVKHPENLVILAAVKEIGNAGRTLRAQPILKGRH